MTTNIELLDAKDLEEHLYDPGSKNRAAPYKIPIQRRKGEPAFFTGYHYFGPDDACRHIWRIPQTKYILAYEFEEKNPNGIIGVLKMGVYNCFNSVPDYWAVNYVDVREDRRRQGICKSLFRKLNHILTPSDWLVGSFLSKDGIAAKLQEKIPLWVSVCPYFQDNEEFWGYCYERSLLLKRKEEVK